MTLRDLQSSKEDFNELLNMFMLLEAKQGVTYIVYAQELLKMLSIQGSRCFMICNNDNICGFSIIYPDGKGGCIGQSLYIKPEYRGTKLFSNVIKKLQEYVNDNFDYCDLVATNPIISALYDKYRFDKQYTIYRYKE